MFALRGLVSDFASIVVANLLMLVAIQLTVTGVDRFQDRPGPGRLGGTVRLAVLLGVGFGLWYLSAVVPDLHARILLASGPALALGAELSWKLLRGPARGAVRSTRATGGVTLVVTAFFVVRAAAAIGVEPSALPHPTAPIHRFAFAVYLVLMVSLCFGLAWMTGERLASRLAHVAHTDGLTRLANRSAILELLAVEVERARRSGRTLSVVMVDLDHFKRVNDAHGHAAGDHALEQLSDVIRAQVRFADRVGRLGGEEFLVVLAEANLGAAAEVAERIRDGIRRQPLELGSTRLRLTASFGVAELQAADADAEALLGRSDAALYRAKRSGRDRVALDPVAAQAG